MPTRPRQSFRKPFVAAVLAAAVGLPSSIAIATPVFNAWASDGPDDTVAVAAAAVAGWYATADAFEDNIEVRDIRQNLLRTITRSELQTFAPWMTLTGGPDGPAALAWTDSGRNLFILVTDAAVPGDGLGSDVVLRYDVPSNSLSLFARLDANASESAPPHLAVAHFKGRLYVAESTGGVRSYAATTGVVSGSLGGTYALPDGGPVRGLAIDRDGQRLYAASATNLYRSNATSGGTLAWTVVGTAGSAGAELRAVAFADHFGAGSGSQRGLYVLRDNGTGGSIVSFVPAAQAQGTQTFSPSTYTTSSELWHDLCTTADGAILIARDEDAFRVTDSLDTSRTFDAWMQDEFNQVLRFSRGLIAPDNEPSGWVIDADVIPMWSRFHPATPDAAAWTTLMLIAGHVVNADGLALSQIQTVLERYAWPSVDPIRTRTSDGIYRHWIDPANGDVKSGWSTEYATLSSMKIVVAAARAWSAFSDDPRVVRAASRIIFGHRNWATYIATPGDGLWFTANVSGGPILAPQGGVRGRPFNEGLMFAEQASIYGSASAATQYARWINRSLWPVATYPTFSGLSPVTGDFANSFQPAFITAYANLLSKDFRANAAWRTHVQNARWSHAAWTDDNGPRYATVFSAGATKDAFNPGGYNADSLTSHPGDVTTLTALLALGATGDEADVVGAYHAFRKGARQSFKTGASILFRRSEVDRAWSPTNAGLPDVAMGGLGLAELLYPGFTDSSLAIDYPSAPQCPIDVNADGRIDIEDLYVAISGSIDTDGSGTTTADDTACLVNWLRRNEAASAVAGH